MQLQSRFAMPISTKEHGTNMNIILKKPQAIILDFDNTLVDTIPLIENARIKTLEKFRAGRVITQEDIITSTSDKTVFFKQFEEQEQEAIKFFLDTYVDLAEKNLVALDGAEETLKLIQSYNLQMSIVSNKLNTLLYKELARLNWTTYFKAIIGSGDTVKDKPHVEPIMLALSQMSIQNTQDVWLIGDSTIDMKCALSSGCVPILYGSKEEFDANLIDESNLTHVADHDSLQKMLRKIL